MTTADALEAIPSQVAKALKVDEKTARRLLRGGLINELLAGGTEVLDLYYTPEEIATALKVHKNTALDLIKQGAIRGALKLSTNCIRVPAAAVNDYIRRTRITQEASA